MRKIVLISLGGAGGAICRYLVKTSPVWPEPSLFPLDTLMINIGGSFLLALLLTLAFGIWELDDAVRLGLASGFLGAFTTFSTLCKETAALLNQGDYAAAAAYISLSSLLGLTAAFLGVVLARKVMGKLAEKHQQSGVV